MSIRLKESSSESLNHAGESSSVNHNDGCFWTSKSYKVWKPQATGTSTIAYIIIYLDGTISREEVGIMHLFDPLHVA